MQYVGQTNQQVSKRMNSHRFDINNYDSQGYTSNVASQFNLDSHSITDLSFLPIDVVSNEMTRLCKETYWIHKRDTMNPRVTDSFAGCEWSCESNNQPGGLCHFRN